MIGLRDQVSHVKMFFPRFSAWIKNGELISVGELQPTPLSDTYRVRIKYRVGKTPQVHVLSPALMRPDGVSLPHVYPGERLCLHLPKEWTNDHSLGRHLIPWIAEWLFFYESWIATGSWLGGGLELHAKVE